MQAGELVPERMEAQRRMEGVLFQDPQYFVVPIDQIRMPSS